VRECEGGRKEREWWEVDRSEGRVGEKWRSGCIEKERLERLRLVERVGEEEETRVAGRGS